ncbi:CYFA0S02e02366g1_1 [Cyberlindnera fabianii]|uniref:CYFA0S02e02366g1_1 n=1 Tax=Cyberlindnera fabianii TaxID=36022 RepID=A0A061AUX7_CYBFA|nr:hypothetical protein BON22_4125 [Cyberlindnera fabianii]CDR38500.1 CYFA0S02e02366g1_1 [Cyberlindnera fabianii]
MPAPAPSTFGRVVAGTIGLLIGGSVTYYMTKDYQLIKYTPPELNADGTPKHKKVQVQFREMQPLELTPEAKMRRQAKLSRARVQEAEQIIQEPTS